jgi:transcriptional regulator with XRE-family HTH domain
MEFKDRLKAARRHSKLGQIALAEKVGINQTSISDLERGKSKATAYTAQLAAACGVSAIWLAEGVGEMLAPSRNAAGDGSSRPPLGGDSSRTYQQQKYEEAAPAHRQAVDEIADKMLGISEAQALRLKRAMELLLQTDEPNQS